MPQTNGSDYATLTNVLFWVAIVLSVIVVLQVIYYGFLCFKFIKRKNERDKLAKEKASSKSGEKMMSVALLSLIAVFPTSYLVVCIILLIECGMLTFTGISLTKEIKRPLEEPKAKVKAEPKPVPVVVPVVPKVVEPTEEEKELVSELVRETITIEEAHSAISDTVATHFVKVEHSVTAKRYTKKSIINIDTLSENFNSGDVVNLEALIEKGLVNKGTDFVKVLARGLLDKHLTVEAQDFSADAIKMIILTGGEAVETD